MSSVFAYLSEVDVEETSAAESTRYRLSIRLMIAGGPTPLSERRITIRQRFDSKAAAEAYARDWVARESSRFIVGRRDAGPRTAR